MIGLALRSMGQRKLRAALTALAVLLGVAMIAGTYVQTDRISTAFEDIEQTAREGTDVVVVPEEAFSSDLMAVQTFEGDLADRVRAVPGVARAEGQLMQSGSLVVDGEAIAPDFAPTLVVSWLGAPFSPLRFTDGRGPEQPGEVAINRQLAEDEGLEVGRNVGLTTRTGVQPVVISGIADYGAAGSLGGSTLVVPLLSDVQRWFENEGEISEIAVEARPGVAPEELADRVRAALPDGFLVRTGEQTAQETAEEINDSIGGFLTPALLTFAGAALLVGAFIIFNTFSITVAQRTREFGLLRTLGATRRQILAAVVVEALAIGLVASLGGLLAGLGFAAALGALFDAVGFGIPAAGLALATRTIVIALAVGILVTLVAAVVPALRATRVPPVAALREDLATAVPSATGRRRLAPWVAGGVSVLGLVLLLQGLFGAGPATGRLGALAGGAVLLFVGVALVARYVIRPVAAAIGWPLERAFDEPGRLARENAMRNPGRTATTSAALMVGLGLVVFVAVFAAGLSTSINASMDRLIRGDAGVIIVTGKGFQPLSEGVGARIRETDGVGAVSPQYVDYVQVNGRDVNQLTDTMIGVDPRELLEVYEPEWVEGDDALITGLRGDAAVIEEQFGETHEIGVGDRFEVETPAGRTGQLRAVGIYRDPQLLQGFLIRRGTFTGISTMRDPFAIFASTARGADPDEVEEAVRGALAGFPTAEVRSQDAYRDVVADQINQVVYLLYALLAMSLLISLFGIANSLFLSIHERTREFGLLRAVGATQTQVRRIVRYESVITAVIGGLLGTAIGIVFAALATAALGNLGLELSIPVGQLVVFLLLAVVVGVVGATLPARRAAGVDVLEAMHAE
jgi:putative ABC transport system permease protein